MIPIPSQEAWPGQLIDPFKRQFQQLVGHLFTLGVGATGRSTINDNTRNPEALTTDRNTDQTARTESDFGPGIG